MSPYTKTSLFFIGLALCISCTKELKQTPDVFDYKAIPTYDTIKPLNYFPVFPGSYWQYVDTKNDTTILYTDKKYKKDFYTESGRAFISDTFFVPIYNNIPIWEYQEHEGRISNSGSSPFKTILSDSLPVGTSWLIYNGQGTGISRKIIAKDTSITIRGIIYSPTIVVEEYYSLGPPPPGYIWIAKRYYTKNIGLIREDINQDTLVQTKQIIDYFINR